MRPLPFSIGHAVLFKVRFNRRARCFDGFSKNKLLSMADKQGVYTRNDFVGRGVKGQSKRSVFAESRLSGWLEVFFIFYSACSP
jgi:hypothetical protein